MTMQAGTLHFDMQRTRSRPARSWRRALQALRGLIEDPTRTHLVIEIYRALDPDLHERLLTKMLAHREGRRVYADRPSLEARLLDVDALRALPEESFGRAYLAHMEAYGLSTSKLVELGREARRSDAPSSSDIHWLRERMALAHDLWHVLFGYGSDPLGEAPLLFVTLGQQGGRANLLLALGANLRLVKARGLGWIGYCATAWRRSRRAVYLAALPYEELLALPLADVRRAAGIDPPERAHPGGIARGTPRESR